MGKSIRHSPSLQTLKANFYSLKYNLVLGFPPTPLFQHCLLLTCIKIFNPFLDLLYLFPFFIFCKLVCAGLLPNVSCKQCLTCLPYIGGNLLCHVSDKNKLYLHKKMHNFGVSCYSSQLRTGLRKKWEGPKSELYHKLWLNQKQNLSEYQISHQFTQQEFNVIQMGCKYLFKGLNNKTMDLMPVV